MYKRNTPYNTPLRLLIPTVTTVLGVEKKTFPAINKGVEIFGSFKAYGGTEGETNGVVTVFDTAIIETWYRPDIKSDCRIVLPETGEVYEIMGKPENIDKQNLTLKMKVRAVEGGA